MPDIRIVPANAIMSFTSSLNFIQKITQDTSGSLNLYGSGSTGRTEILSVDGNNGRLFTVSDDLSDSLFSVNTIAGLPVIEAFANNSVNIGQYSAPPIKVTGSLAIITGSLLGTASYTTQALSASMASLVAIATQDTTSNTYNITFTGGTSGNNSLNVDATTLTYNPNTGIFATNRISATSVTASLQGTASYASQAATASWATNVTNNGVTSVSASGTVSGITLGGGPITSTGTLTLSGTVSGLTNSNLSGTAGITNANLATSAIQIGSTNMSLGMGYSTITGLASVTSTAFTGSFSGSHFGPLTGTASYATNALTASFLNTLDQDVTISKLGGTILSIGAGTYGGPELRLLPNSTGGFAKINVGNANSSLDFQMNSATCVTLTQNGLLGVGITSPTSGVHVQRNAAGPVGYTNLCAVFGDNTASGSSYTNSVGVAGRVIQTGSRAIYGDASTGGGWAGYFDGKGYFSGSVGISITSPDTKLHIEDITKTLTGNVSGVAQGTLSLVSTDAQAADKGASLVFGGNYLNSSSTRIAFAGITGRKSNSSTGNADGYLSFLTWRTSGLTEAMRITANGDVGIGVTSVQGKLHVYQSTNLGGTAGNSLILQSLQNTGGSGGNNVYVKDYAVRDATGTDWTTWRHHNSIDVDGSHNTPGTNTKAFYERDPLSGLHEFGQEGTYAVTIDGTNSRIGIATRTPSFPLSFGTGLGNKIALYDAGSGAGYGFGIQSQLLQMFSNTSGDDIAFGYGNSAAFTRNVTFKGTGNVGIGTASPVTKLDVTINDNAYGSAFTVTNTNTGSAALSQLVLSTANNSTGLFQIRQFNNGGAVEMANYANAPVSLWTSGSERMRIHANGKVSVNNTDNTAGQFSVSNNASVTSYNTTFRMTEGATFKNDTILGWNVAGQYSFFGNYQSFPLTLRTNDTNRVWITAGGAMGLGVTPTNTLGRFEASNDIVAYSSSDKNWKTNIKNIDSPLQKISQINGVEFDWIEDEPVHGNKGHDIGVIAQEIEQILPEAVQTRESGMKAVKYEKVIPLLIEAIKDQQKQIEQLKQIVNGITG